ncbi:MAG TPA: transporter [Verrucomicrobiae bacterium]|nr:transporter [Verrucomicrobiae bacterium]
MRAEHLSSNWQVLGVVLLLLFCANRTTAQGGPPLLTNDPVTPDHGNWEINLGAMPVLTKITKSVEVLQIDLNYALTDRIELIYEVPFVWQSATGQPNATGWGNGLPGVKLRLIDGGENGWNLSTFPQVQIGGSAASVKKGLADEGTRFLLPFEVSKRFGPLNADFEVGYFFPLDSSASRDERILGLALGHKLTPKLETIGEIYDDKVMGAPEHNTEFDMGGRWEFHKGLLFLFMAGRSFKGNSSGQPEFLGYGGIRILLDHYGTRLHSDK